MNTVLTHRLGLSLILGATFLSLSPGCAPKQTGWESDAWVNGYQLAETRASERETGIILCYRDTPPNRPDPMIHAARDAIANDSKSDYVGTVLNKSYAWDRKYVAQFGVDRSPALIVLHPDGTYHAHVGSLDAAGVQEFLAGANPPGHAPKWNAFLHREPRYTWQPSTEEAESIARESNRSMLMVFHRPWSDDLQRMNRILKNPAVYRRLSGMVHVRTGLVWSFSETVETKYGTLQLPALVIVQPNGTYRILERPRSYEDVVRFADNTTTTDETRAATTPATTVVGSN